MCSELICSDGSIAYLNVFKFVSSIDNNIEGEHEGNGRDTGQISSGESVFEFFGVFFVLPFNKLIG